MPGFHVAQGLGHQVAQLGGLEGFRQEVLALHVVAGQVLVQVHFPGHEDHRDVPDRLVLLDGSAEVVSGALGHDDVRDDQVRFLLPGLQQALLARPGTRQDLVIPLQNAGRQGQGDGFIVHHEYAGLPPMAFHTCLPV